MDDDKRLSWDDAFGDLDARTLSPEQRLDFVNRHVTLAMKDRGWAVRGGGDEAQLVWHDAVRTFVEGIWVACVLCCHAVCEREVAGILAVSPANLAGEIDKRWDTFGLGRLLAEAEREKLLPLDEIAALRQLADARKPYGHWRSFTHEDSLDDRLRRESLATGHMDRLNLIDRLIVRDASNAIVTTARLVFGSYAVGG